MVSPGSAQYFPISQLSRFCGVCSLTGSPVRWQGGYSCSRCSPPGLQPRRRETQCCTLVTQAHPGLSLRVGYSGASADSITTHAPQVRAGGGLGMFPSADLEDPCLILKHFSYFPTDSNIEWPRALIRSEERAGVGDHRGLGPQL